MYLSSAIALLEEDIKNGIHTHQFLEKINELGLIKPINVLVHYQGGGTNTLKGLHTIDEEKLQSIAIAEIDGFARNGLSGADLCAIDLTAPN